MNTKVLKTILTLLIALAVGVVFTACVTDDSDSQPTGFCNTAQDATPGVGTPCSANASTCADGLLCFVAGDSSNPNEVGICVRGCESASECGDNIECVGVNNGGNTGGGTSTGGTSTGGTSTGGTSTGGTSTGGTSTGGTSTGGTSTGGTGTSGNATCDDACRHFWGCLGDICDQGVIAQLQGGFNCVADCEADPEGFDPAGLAGLSCDDLNAGICQANPDLANACACPGGGGGGGDCPDGQQCADVTGGGNFQCVEGGGVPASTNACGPNGECDSGFTCYQLSEDPTDTGCLQNCSGGGGGGGGGCASLLQCLQGCAQGDDACVQGCAGSVDNEAIELYNAVGECFNANCANDQSQECLDANCGAEWDACLSD